MLSPGSRLGPFEIVGLIGKGGMGQVFRAVDTRLAREVAIKVLAEQYSERFTREAKTIAALNHPNICTLYEVGPNYLVMEHLQGKPISGPLQWQEVVEYAHQIAQALDAAHPFEASRSNQSLSVIKVGWLNLIEASMYSCARRVVTSRSTNLFT